MRDGPTEAGEEPRAGAREPDAAPASCLLFVTGPDGDGQLLELRRGQSVLLGRAASADVRLDDSKLSREHARLRWSERDVLVEDLGSRNGTRVDGTTIVSASLRLADGARVELGRSRLVVSYVRASAAPGPPADDSIVVDDSSMRRVHALAGRLGATSTPVLLLGETGVGKDVVAQAIHAHDPRGGPFVRFNCAAIPEGLLESALFGHEKGAFTGADRRTVGLVESARGGTLFLDEIGELPLSLQAKLLHVLESRSITRVGSTQEIPVDVRILAATHRDLEAASKSGAFRLDLYYRVAVFTLEIPPLRRRSGEIVALARHFLEETCAATRRSVPELGPDTLAALRAHAWPGNVRELRNAMEHALVLAQTRIEPEHLPPAVVGSPAPAPRVAADPSRDLPGALEQLERQRIAAALEAEGGNRTRAAKRLGISRRALQYKISKFGLP